jgi:hypothetical protein
LRCGSRHRGNGTGRQDDVLSRTARPQPKTPPSSWLAEHVAAPLRPLLALLPVPEGHVRVRAAVAMRGLIDGRGGAMATSWLHEEQLTSARWAIATDDAYGLRRLAALIAGFIVADVKIPRVAEVVGEVSCG